MPDTRLILHVKGTEAETAELPKEAVRAAISEGKITHSQLIWVAHENTWKPVRELPELLPVPIERLILHVKGTESQTAELPKTEVRAGISQGKITHSQLIWVPSENAWKQVRELPDLLPSQKLAPAPSRIDAEPAPKMAEAIIPESPSSPVDRAVAATPQPRSAAATGSTPKVRVAAAAGSPQVRVAAASGSVPKVKAAGGATPVPKASSAPPQARAAAVPVRAQVKAAPILVRTTGEIVVKEDHEAHPLKWVCIGLSILILVVLGGNYFLVDKPLVSNLSETSFANDIVYAHLGAFMQPNVMVIHIPHSEKITPANLTKFLAALAHSTPLSPVSRDLYSRVALTVGWTAQYSFSGYGWKELGDMENEDEAQRKEFLMDQMDDAGGQPLMPETTLNEQVRQSKRDQVWNDFVTYFTANQ